MWFFTEEEKQIKELCADFARRELAPVAEKHDTDETFNIEAFKKMGELGVLGITADPKYGGAGMGAVAATIVMEEFGKACASSTLSYLAHSILCVNNIQNNASEEQKEKYLPKLISGEHIGCMGMSEPEYGSDAVGIQTKAEKKDDHYLLNGTKMWITNAEYADVAYVYTRTGKERKNLSTFIVDKGAEGFSIGKPIHKMGMRASPTGELVFDNCKVPHSALVGNEGDSIYHMMKNLELERITIAGISLGIAQACVDQCIKYANERSQFGKTIGCLKYESAQNTLNIIQIQISPEFQNKGHGYRLLKHIIDNSASKTISLTVLKVNPAYHLYTRLGFTTVGKDEHEYHMQLNR